MDIVINTSIQPKSWQYSTIEFILNNFGKRGCLVNAAPGLGKTLSSLWAIDNLFAQDKITRVLIVAPLTTITENVWLKEMKFFPHLTYSILLGTKANRIKQINNNSQLDFINHDGVSTLLSFNKDNSISKSKSILPLDYDVIIYDESTLMKNHKSLKYKSMMKYLEISKSYIILMTGTPVSNSPLDAYTQIKLINENFTYGMTMWKETTMYQTDPWNWKAKSDSYKQIAKLMQPCLTIKVEDCLDLPEFTIIPYKIPLSKQQATLINNIKKDSFVNTESGCITAYNPATAISKIMQTIGGVVYSDKHNELILDFTERYDALLDIIKTNNSPTVVFCSYKSVQAELIKKLTKDGIRCALINGDVHNREEILNKFDKYEYDVLICHEKTTAFGLDLTISNTLIFYLPIYSNELYQQALARIRRVSSLEKGHKNFRIFHFYSTKYEEERYKILQQRENYQVSLKDELIKLQEYDFSGEAN